MIVPYPNKFLIMGNARTGTTQLTSICNNHPDLTRPAYEPFKHLGWGQKVSDGEVTLREAVRDLYNQHDGIKELFQYESVNNQFRDMIFHLPIQVIVIERRNKLRQAVSHVLASMSGIWQQQRKLVEDGSYPEKVQAVGELSAEAVDRCLKMAYFGENRLREELELAGKSHYKICYEDFYFGDESEQRRVVCEMFDFIGVRPIFNDTIKDFLKYGRLNNEETYRRISNVDEIDHIFKEHGHLIDRS